MRLHACSPGAAALLLLLAGCVFPLDPTALRLGNLGNPAATVPVGTADGSGTGPGAGTGTSGGSSPTSDDLTGRFPGCQDAPQGDSWRATVLELLNRERTSQGLSTLAQDQTLTGEANDYACQMIYYNFFAHVNPATGSTLAERADAFGYDYLVIGENLAAGQQSPGQAVSDWMASPSHRENMLDPRFTEVGVGLRAGGEYEYYWVLEFGLPQ